MGGGRAVKELNTVDLFCGAGGATTGLELALKRIGATHRGVAINHWRVAVDTMRRNHPLVDTKQMSIEEAVPDELVPGGVVDLLWASPSCTHHSRAKGGKPRSNQLRAQPELVLTWLDQLFVRRLIIENVPEFVDWGPLTKAGKPIKKLKGSCFHAWIAAIEARNYTVEWRIVNCADYGDATSRRRFFLKAVRKGCGKIRWPEPTHAENPQPDLFGRELTKWRGVRECLDLSDLGTSIFNRDRPLSGNTLRRVAVGMAKYNGMDFLLDMLGSDGDDYSRVHPLTKPLPTQHSGGNRCAVVTPFIMNNNANNVPRPLDKPLVTLTTGNHAYLCTPLILGQQGGATCRPMDDPCPTIATAGAIRVATPIILDMSRPGRHDSGHIRSADKPIQTLTTCDNVQIATPVIVDMSHPGDPNDERRVSSGDEPIRTITTRNNKAVVSPVIFDEAVGLPRLPDGRYIDIFLRMLKPSELAAAHSFPPDYVLTGNRGEQVKQIGNSVPVMTAAAMCEADLAAA